MSTPSASAADVDLYGDPTLLFGLPSDIKTLIGGMAVTELKGDAEVQFQATAEGQDAEVAALAVSKKKKFSGTGSGFLLNYATFLAVKTFLYDGNTYIITKWGKAYNFKEFQKADFSYIGYEGVAAAGGGTGS